MKSFRHILFLATVLLLTLSLSAAVADDSARFSAEDLTLNTLQAGAQAADVRALLGEPESVEPFTYPADGDAREAWYYEGLTLSIAGDGTLVDVSWTDPALIGPRGLKVGDSAQTVLSAFYRDSASGNDDILYAEGYVPELNAYLPPCGIITRLSRDNYIIEYLAPVEPYGEDVVANPACYVYQSHASVMFFCDRNDTVTSIGWAEGPLAE